jgi:hypothetical protein
MQYITRSTYLGLEFDPSTSQLVGRKPLRRLRSITDNAIHYMFHMFGAETRPQYKPACWPQTTAPPAQHKGDAFHMEVHPQHTATVPTHMYHSGVGGSSTFHMVQLFVVEAKHSIAGSTLAMLMACCSK